MLDEIGMEARHIMTVSGHKSENSIRSYSKTSLQTKRQMSAVLSSSASLDYAPPMFLSNPMMKKMKVQLKVQLHLIVMEIFPFLIVHLIFQNNILIL